MNQDSPEARSPSNGRGAAAALIVGGAVLMQTLDSTLVAMALPSMALEFDVEPAALNTVITVYIVGAAVSLPISGWAADRFGARTTFLFAIAVFLAASVASGLAPSLDALFASRFAQGGAGAMLLPVGRLVLLKSTEKSNLVRAMAYLTVPALLGPALGPLLGGFISTYLDWNWIFFLNVPVGFIGAGLVAWRIPNLREASPLPIDWRGFVLSACALGALAFVLENLAQSAIPPLFITMAAMFGVIMCGAYYFHGRAMSRPILDFTLLATPTFAAATLGGFFSRLTVAATPFLLSLLFQVAFGMNAFAAGKLMFATAVGSIAMTFSAMRICKLFGVRRVLIVNGGLTAASFIAFTLFSPSTSQFTIIAVLVLHGFLRSLQLTALNAMAFVDVEDGRLGAAATLAGVAQLVAQVVAVAGSALLLDAFAHLIPDAPNGLAIRCTFVAIGIATLFSLLWFVRLDKNAGASLIGKA